MDSLRFSPQYRPLNNHTPPEITSLIGSPVLMQQLLQNGPTHTDYMHHFAQSVQQGIEAWFGFCFRNWTGSGLGSILGLDQPKASKRLGQTFYGQSTARQAWQQGMPGLELLLPPSPPSDKHALFYMQYGKTRSQRRPTCHRESSSNRPSCIPHGTAPRNTSHHVRARAALLQLGYSQCSHAVKIGPLQPT